MAAIKYIFPSLAECANLFDIHAAPRIKKFSSKTMRNISIEYIRQMVINGAFSLGIFYKSDKIIGIAIQYKIVDALTGDTGLHVLFASIDPGHNATAEIATILDDLAKCFGYKFVSMSTTRTGWGRIRLTGWELEHITWSKQYGGR